jgi:hypothetical protein
MTIHMTIKGKNRSTNLIIAIRPTPRLLLDPICARFAGGDVAAVPRTVVAIVVVLVVVV